MSANKNHTPLFHIVKRDQSPWYYNLGVRAIAVVSALILCAVVIFLLTIEKQSDGTLKLINPLDVYGSMIEGSFGN